MNRLFNISEILQTIFTKVGYDISDYIDFDLPFSNPHQVLYRLILVNRTFYRAAISLLWRSVHISAPLRIMCHDSNIWERIREDKKFDVGALEPSTPKTMERFLYYGAFIRELFVDLGDDDDSTIFDLFPLFYDAHLHELQESRTDLFPSLKSLRWTLSSPASLRMLLCVISSGLKSLAVLRTGEFEDVLARIPQRLQGANVILTKLEYCPIGTSPTLYDRNCVAEILKYQGATCRSLDLDVRVFIMLVQSCPIVFATLRELELSPIPAYWVDDIGHIEAPVHCSLEHFPVLQTLRGSVECANQRFWTRFLSGAGACMRELSLCSGEAGDDVDVTEALSFLTDIPSNCPVLQSLDVRLTFHDGTSAEDLVCMLRPVYKCSRLKSVTLHAWCSGSHDVTLGLCLKNQDILDMAHAWSDLEILNIESSRTKSSPKPSVSLQAIAFLCALCPKLHTLRLTLDATSLPPHVGTTPHLPSRSMRKWDPDESPISKPVQIACWLLDVCPYVRVHSCFKASSRLWERVQHKLDKFQKEQLDVEVEKTRNRLTSANSEVDLLKAQLAEVKEENLRLRKNES